MSSHSRGKTSKVVWITGAGGGLGQALVAAFAQDGWKVAAAYHAAHPFPDADPIWPMRLDVTSPDETARVSQQILQRWDRISVLVNNAGLIADRLLGRLEVTDWQRVVAVNLKGAYLCCRAVLPSMIHQGGGHIINLASFAARKGSMGQSNYAAAKAGLIGLTGSLAKEVGPHNVQVNVVLPGLLPTAMTAQMTQAQLEQCVAENALQRMNSLEEVARFIVFLASMKNVSGQLFQLDSRIARWT